jgi:hypothetical protein
MAVADNDAWECSCGQTGTGPADREHHKQVKASAALKRLNQVEVWSTVVVTAGVSGRRERNAIQMIGMRGYHSDRLRPFIHGTYDGYGVLSAFLDWDGIAAAVAAGRFPDDEALLPLRIALSLLGKHPINLGELERLWNDDDRANAREILAGLLPADT